MEKLKSIAVPVTRRDAVARTKKTAPKAQDGDVGPPLQFQRQPPQTTARPVHRYRVGDRLIMARGSRDIARAAAACEVTAIVPHEMGPLFYRVRSDSETFERIVDEIDLAPMR